MVHENLGFCISMTDHLTIEKNNTSNVDQPALFGQGEKTEIRKHIHQLQEELEESNRTLYLELLSYGQGQQQLQVR